MTISPVPPLLDMTVMCASGVVPMPTQPPVVTTVPAMSTATVTSREVDVRPGPSRVRPLPRLGLASTSVGEEGAGRDTPFYADVGAYCSGPEGGWWASHPPVCSSGLSHSVFFVDDVQPVGPLLCLRRWLGGMRVTRRYHCPPIVFGRDTLRMFRKRAVSSMYHRFCRDF